MFGFIGCIQKSVLLPAQQRVIAEIDMFEGNSGSLMRNTHVDGSSAAASTTPVADLRHISVASLRLDQRHKGFKVEGTVFCKATRQVAVQVLLEDVKNTSHAVKISMYNLVPASARMSQVRHLLPEGTKLAIKDPYYKVFLDGTSGIRVDNPADVVFVARVDEESFPDEAAGFEHNKTKGNKAFRSAPAVATQDNT